MDYVHVYDVLTQARECIFDWVRPLSQEQYTRTFPFGFGTLRATLIETARTELFYRMRLRGEPLPPPPPIQETFPISETNQPTFADLERAWTAQSKETRAALAETTEWSTLMHRQRGRQERRLHSQQRGDRDADAPARGAPPRAGDGHAAPVRRTRPEP